MKNIGLDIIFEDNHIIAVNKPPGILSQKDNTGDDSIIEMIKDYLKIKYDKPGNVFVGSVHRIDRPASGLLVFAKTGKALSRLTESMRKSYFTKKYYAIIEGKTNENSGTLEHYLLKDNISNTVKVFKEKKQESKYSALNYKKLATSGNRTLFEIELITGRPHQIRAQLSFVFGPILGDVKYGSDFLSSKHKIYLHSFFLSFPHPTLRTVMEFCNFPDLNDNIWNQFRKYIQ